jgi:hypothetical protein
VLAQLKKQKGVVFWTGEQILEWYRKIGKTPKAKRTR